MRKMRRERTLTNKQRRANAHAHYIGRHDTPLDAVRFLEGDTANTPAATLEEVKLLAAKATKTVIPTWSDAAAMLFSCSGDSLGADSSWDDDSLSPSLMKL